MTANMIGVRFRDASKIYHFAPPDEVIHEGEYVVVETARGMEMARVVTVPPEDAGPVPTTPGRSCGWRMARTATGPTRCAIWVSACWSGRGMLVWSAGCRCTWWRCR